MANRTHLIALKLVRPYWLSWHGRAQRSGLAKMSFRSSLVAVIVKTLYRESGYIVESKRGGGGYIRSRSVSDHQMLQDLAANIGETISHESSGYPRNAP